MVLTGWQDPDDGERDRTQGSRRYTAHLLHAVYGRSGRAFELGLLEERDEANATIAAEGKEAELSERFIAIVSRDLRNPLAPLASGLRRCCPKKT